MIRKVSAVLILFFSFALYGCGNGGTEPQAAKNNVSNPRDSNGTAPARAEPSVNDTNVALADTNGQTENPLTAARNKKLEAMRSAAKDPSAPKPDLEETLRKSTQPAPENSEFSVALTNILFERRTFLKHPILRKIEKVTDGEKKTIRVFTTDGRTIQLSGDAIESVSNASSASILKAAGLAVQTTKPSQKKSAAANEN